MNLIISGIAIGMVVNADMQLELAGGFLVALCAVALEIGDRRIALLNQKDGE